MTRHYTIKETQAHLPAILDEVADGQTVVIEQAGRPVAQIVAVTEPVQGKIQYGLLKGRGMIPDDFDTMGQDEIRDMFGTKP